jgi:hypothetical protein
MSQKVVGWQARIMTPSLETSSGPLTSQYAQLAFRKIQHVFLLSTWLFILEELLRQFEVG